MFFKLLIGIVILQRLIELRIARKNERWMRAQGAFEVGQSHYPYMVLMHLLFFISLIVEVTSAQMPLATAWVLYFAIFLAAQGFRIWCLVTLGHFWNTKILILPGASVIKKGPYRWLRHPNYVIVSVELMTLPLMFNAYFTAFLFTVLNLCILRVRIPIEEQALREATNYNEQFATQNKVRV